LECTEQREGSAEEKDTAEGEKERAFDCALDFGGLFGIGFGRDLGSGEVDALGSDVGAELGCDLDSSEFAIETGAEGVNDEDAEYSDGEQAGDARDGIVDAGGDSGMIAINGVHDDGGERRDTDGHSESEDEKG